MPSIAAATWATAQWCRNRQKPRSIVPENPSQGVPTSTPNFDGTCDDLKGTGLVFNSADLRTYRFMHVRHEIPDYVGKEYLDGRDVRWTLE